MIWRPMVKKAVVARSTAALQSSISRTRSALRRSHAPREAIIVIAGAPFAGSFPKTNDWRKRTRGARLYRDCHIWD